MWGNFRDESNNDRGDGYLYHRLERLTVPVMVQIQSSSPVYVVAGLALSYVVSQRDLYLAGKSQSGPAIAREIVFDDFTPKVRRWAPGVQAGLGAAFALGAHGEVFAELTTAALATQGFRAGFRVLDVSTNPSGPFPSATPQNGWQKSAALTVGLRFGGRAAAD